MTRKIDIFGALRADLTRLGGSEPHVQKGNRIWIFAANEKPTKDLPDAAEHHLDGYFGVNSITDGQMRLPCHVQRLALPKSVDSGNLSLNKLVIRRLPVSGDRSS